MDFATDPVDRGVEVRGISSELNFILARRPGYDDNGVHGPSDLIGFAAYHLFGGVEKIVVHETLTEEVFFDMMHFKL